MRLLTYDRDGELRITRDLVDNIPSYAILSHTWGADEEEVAYHEVLHPSSKKKTGYAKIHFCGQQAARDGYQHFWVDTCCINKDSHVELSEAITSMYRWYQQAQICYVYLADVSTCLEVDGFCGRSWERAFRESRWFTRGWTLQELLAPKEVVFFSREGERLGSKTSLEELLSDITGIPLTALRGQSLSQFSVAERMRWTQGRRTKRKEDQAYCLLGIFNVFMYLNYGEGDNAFVRLTEETNKVPKANFTLRIAEGATFDAHGQIHQPCHPATRLDLLQSVRDWTQCVDGKNIFWLNGVAGTGKSTISWTIAKWLSDLGSGGPVALGASFFFKRGEGDRASATLLFPTIANQLAIYISHFDVFLAQAIKAHPQICSKSLGEQFNKLICEPLRQLPTGMGQSTFVLVVDALDECDNEDDIRTVLQLWSRLPRVSGVRLRLFLTSRPELVIRLGFRKMSIEIHQDVVLHDVPQPIIQHDILAFLTDALADIRKEYNLEPMGDPLADDWPGSELLEKLTSLAIPLFIVAATIVRYVAERRQPRQRLQTLLQSRVRPYTSRLGCIYQPVLQAMTSSTNSEQERAQIHKDFRTVVGAIVLLVEPLSSPALAELLDVPLEMIRFCLWPLHSVLHIPQDHTAVIRPLHLSFSEYLTSQDTLNTPFNVNAPATHGQLWRQCLRLLSGPDGLREDICCLRCPGQLRHEISAGRIAKYLPLAVKYACRYWVYHVQSSTSRVSDGDEVHTFLQEHFLHWLEALSLLDRLADGIELVNILHLQLMTEDSSKVTVFLEDARRFILANRHIGEIAPLQLYSSAIAFAPQKSIVRSFCGRLPTWIYQAPITPRRWSLKLQTLEGHTEWVNAVAFSPDGQLLASVSHGRTVRLWQVSTGREVQQLRGHTGSVFAVVFSPNGQLLVSVSHDRTVRLWQVSTGQEVQQLRGHTGSVFAVAFSPDGRLLASASNDRTVRLWQVSTGQEVQQLRGHTESVNAVAFSPDGQLLASALNDRTVRLWQVSTGQEVQQLRGHTESVSAVAFSPDGQLLASALEDQTVRLWQVSTGQEVQQLRGHTGSVGAVAFSPDGQLLASASWDQTVRLWQVSTGREVQRLRGHTGSVNTVAFSPDGQLLASASNDRTVRLWQVSTSQEVQRLRGRTDMVNAVAFSPDGQLLVSVSHDRTVRLWQVSTGREVQQLRGHTESVNAVAFSPDGQLLASASNDRTVRLWQVSTGQEVQQLRGHTESVRAVAFSPNGQLLVSVLWDRTVRLWQVSTGREVQQLRGHTGLVNAVVFSPNGQLLVSASWDQTVRLWQVSTGREVQQLRGHTGSVNAVAFSPDGRLLASASNDRTVRLWQVSTGQEVQQLRGHTESVRAVAFSPDGQLLASASQDQTVRLWQVSTGQEVHRFNRIGYTSQVRFTSDNSALHTDRGYLKINMLSSLLPLTDPNIDYGLTFNHDWIEYQGQKLLWLPSEYRSEATAVFGNVVGIGRANGTVSFLRLKVP